MNVLKTLFLSLLLTLGLWGFYSWPVPRHLAAGIPSSAANVEKDSARRMLQGDHLQLLYNYWLFADMLGGKTRFFHNLYEFNTGNDDERKYVGCDDFPFVFVFAAGNALWNRAAGWNLAGLFSLWLTHWFTWRLLRRYTSAPWLAPLLALLAIATPYRWTTLLGGSPTGYGMTWVALFAWGLDKAVRDRSVAGGCGAALALLFAFWNDVHVFYFTMLFAPLFALGFLAVATEMKWTDRRHWLRLVLAGLPLAIFVGILVVKSHAKQAGIEDSAIGKEGRSWTEVMLCSPMRHGLLQWRGSGHEGTIYLGYAIPLLVALGFLTQLSRTVRAPREQWRRTALFAVTILMIVAAVGLGLGVYGPDDGKWLKEVRKHVPGYDLIRQPAKIFVVMPILLAIGAALSLESLRRLAAERKAAFVGACAAGLLIAGLVEYGLQIRPTVCLLDYEQRAYKAVAVDAAAAGKAPRAVVLPIWPGDSSWASLYEHYVSLYRIRMVNGYQPAVPREYVDNVFGVLEPANTGLLESPSLELLAKMGVDYVLLHEDAFPEKVSHFPVAFTLKRLLAHPRLRLLAQDGSVWAFKIVPGNPSATAVPADWSVFFPNFHYELEWASQTNGLVAEDSLASGGRFLRLAEPGAAASLRPLEHLSAPEPFLLMRCRGTGQASMVLQSDTGGLSTQRLDAASSSWGWRMVSLQNPAPGRFLTCKLLHEQGSVDLDLALFISGQVQGLQPGPALSLPAPLFFHAGHTDLSRNSVVLRADREPADRIFYGPKLPLFPGRFKATLAYQTDAPAGTCLGELEVRVGGEKCGSASVTAGTAATCDFVIDGRDLPVEFGYLYNRAADVTIRAVEFSNTAGL
jgi:hypothetical protein